MTQEALKLALNALERLALPKNADDIFRRAITVIKEALAQTQEPVACIEYIPCCTDKTCPKCKATTPPQRTWVGLTNDELTDLFYNTNLGQASAVAQAIALLKEKNT